MRDYWRDVPGLLDLVAEVMSGGVVLHCEYRYDWQAFDYVMLHPAFKMVLKSEEAPKYYMAWQGDRFVFVDHEPSNVTIECPSRSRIESWLKTVQKGQRDHPKCAFVLLYPDESTESIR